MSRYPRQSTLTATSQHSTDGLNHATSSSNARTAYPKFMPLWDTVILQITWAWKGFLDSCRWDFVITTIAADPEIRANVLKSLILNAVSLTSIYVFDLLLLPLLQNKEKWIHRNIGWFYQVLWLFPVVGASLYLNSSWCNVVARRTYALQYGGRQSSTATTYTGMLTALATSAYRGVMVFTSVILSICLSHIPVVGYPLSFVFFAWNDSYYSFEFIWIARGLSLSQRIRYLEERWAYYFAFGFIPTLLCMWGSGLANAALFALVLPFYIIMAMRANPVPKHPFNPLADSTAETTVRYPSPFIPIRIPVFAPVIWLNDIIVSVLNMGVGRPKPDGRRRGLSESVVESVEEGSINESYELAKIRQGSKGHLQSNRKLVNGFSRRKDD